MTAAEKRNSAMLQLAAVVLLSALALSEFPPTGETLTPAPAASQLPPEP